LYSLNFPDSTLVLKTVQQAQKERWVGVPRNPLIVHGSQPCDEFTLINVRGKESRNSIEIATAFVDAIATLTPWFFSKENVPGYQKSESYRVVCRGLEALGYKFQTRVIRLLGCQQRTRLILLAGKEKPLEFPPEDPVIGWWDVVRPWRSHFVPCHLTERQRASDKITEMIGKYNCPLLIERIFPKLREPHVRLPWEPCWSLTDCWSDGKGGGRSNAINVWLDKKLWSLNVEAIAALQGFPDWYQFSPSWAINGSGIALSVPPRFIERMARHNKLSAYTTTVTPTFK
jgi:site-specific DNA-cytosine methylase